MKDWPKGNTTETAIGFLQEEMGEVQTAIGKCQRFGAFTVWQGERNRDMLLRELQDLKIAIDHVEKFLQ